MRITPILLLTLFLTVTTFAQETRERAIKPDTSAGDFTIVTKVPFDGRNYFIKIVPVDTGNVDRMPIYSGRWDRPLIWNDSLQHLLPDSILNILRERQKQHEQGQKKR